MKIIYVATKSRGFLLNLFTVDYKNVKFIYQKDKIYETSSKKKLILSKLVRSKLADYLGIIQTINVNKEVGDIVFSYNKFLKSNKKYIIYLENPLALVHYSTGRNKSVLGKIRIKKYLKDPNLAGIICLSKACYDTINNFYSIPERIKIEQVYPLVHRNNQSNIEQIKLKCYNEVLNCTYISSDFNLKGGQDILKCFSKLREQKVNNIKLKIITQLKSLDEVSKKEININPNMEVYDFNFSTQELNEVYSNSSILLNPTRQDSFSLVVLEAMKAGNTIITTDLYAIPEMVIDKYNGFLTEPRYRFFTKNNMPNEAVWNNREETIYSDYIDDNIVSFLHRKITYLNENRDVLERMATNSYKKATQGEFSEEAIIDKWKNIFMRKED